MFFLTVAICIVVSVPAYWLLYSKMMNPSINLPVIYDNAWVMSSQWTGSMGVAIAIKGNQYYYWQYSDFKLPQEPEYPIIGNYRNTLDALILDDPKNRLYANKWKFAVNAGRKTLWSERDLGDYARMLIPDPGFNPGYPFHNQSTLKVEQAGGGNALEPPSHPSTAPSKSRATP